MLSTSPATEVMSSVETLVLSAALMDSGAAHYLSAKVTNMSINTDLQAFTHVHQLLRAHVFFVFFFISRMYKSISWFFSGKLDGQCGFTAWLASSYNMSTWTLEPADYKTESWTVNTHLKIGLILCLIWNHNALCLLVCVCDYGSSKNSPNVIVIKDHPHRCSAQSWEQINTI